MRKRRSLLFVPGNNPGMVANAGVFGADGIIFDLEDAVAQEQKDGARILVRNALAALPMKGCERIVRINSMDRPIWLEDLEAVVAGGADSIMLPKAQSRAEMEELDRALSDAEKRVGREEGALVVIALVETPTGVENSGDIATARRVSGMLLGAEDLTAALGVPRTVDGEEISYARGRMVMAAKAAGIDAIDTPFTDTDDMEGLEKDTLFARSIGFDGKALISPRHVEAVNRAFTPTDEEMEWARAVVRALEEGERAGKGAVSVGGKMVDAPVAARARKTLAMRGEA